MLFSVLLFIFTLFLSIRVQDIEKNFENYQCAPDCIFSEPEVKTSTLPKWPVNCTLVCGDIKLLSSSDVPAYQLQETFRNLEVLIGCLSIEKTKYTNTEFLSSLESIFCDGAISIESNNFLKSVQMSNLSYISAYSFHATNNTVLDLSDVCERYSQMSDLYTLFNQFNCDQICYERSENNENCTVFKGAIRMRDEYGPQYLSRFSKIQTINGCILINYSNLTDLSFFKNLSVVNSFSCNQSPFAQAQIHIVDNQNLTRLGLSRLLLLKNIYNESVTISFKRNHPDFCVTTHEMDVFLDSDVVFEGIEAVYCKNEHSETVCEFQIMSNLPENCIGIIGKVHIGSGDEQYVEKLKSVKRIYGALIIESTNLVGFRFLENLEYIALLNDNSSAFQVNHNRELEDFIVPNLKRVYASVKYPVSFKNSGAGNSSTCYEISEKLKQTGVAFNNQSCEVFERMNGTMLDGGCHGNLHFENLVLLLILLIL